MKRLFLLLFLWLAAGLLPAQADGPDDQYVNIYGLIQAGDKLSASAQPSAALPNYLAAQTALQQFQKINPDWNPKVVNFRLNYVAAKILAVSGPAPAESKPTLPSLSPPATTAAPAPAPAPKSTPAPPPAPVAPPPAKPSEPERQLASQVAALQEDVRRAQADKSTLEAKLKEALAAQPAALDPRELAKAQQQLQDLMKENELLKAVVPPETAKPAPDSKPLDETRGALAEANRKLKEESRRADALASEKQILQRQLDKLAPAAEDATKLAEVRKALEAANRDLAAQAELTKKLGSAKDTLEAQVKTLSANAKAVAGLRAENETLKTQLAKTKATPAPPAPDAETARKLAAAEARAGALQSDAEIWRLEKIALENRLRTLSSQTPTTPLASSPAPPPASPSPDSARIKLLEDERKELAQKLAAANKELAGRKGRAAAARIEALDSQIAILRARLEIFEARAVPYTPEELALFSQPGGQLASATPSASPRPIATLPRDAAGFVASAQRHFEAKEFDQAEADYLEVLRRDEKNSGTLANLAAIQLERGNLAEAERSATKAVAGATNDAYSLAILGFVKFRQEKYDAALDPLSRAAQLNPRNPEIQNYLGLTLGHKGLHGPAEAAFRKALALDPSHAGAHNNLAVIYLKQTPPAVELARWHYEKARAAGHPRNAELEKLLQEKEPSRASPR